MMMDGRCGKRDRCIEIRDRLLTLTKPWERHAQIKENETFAIFRRGVRPPEAALILSAETMGLATPVI
jgi:hypothetical protein